MTSDPGTSALLTPFCKTKGLYFNADNEPESFKYEFDKDVENYYGNRKDCLNITPKFDSIEEYYDYNLHCIELNKTLTKEHIERNDLYTIEINIDDEDIT